MNTQRTLCDAVREDLKAYADRELGLLRRLAVRRHLAACADCRKELLIMETLTKELQSDAPPVLLGESLRGRLLDAADASPLTAPAPLAKPLWKRRPLVTAGAGVALATFGVLFSQMYGETMNQNPPKAEFSATSVSAPEPMAGAPAVPPMEAGGKVESDRVEAIAAPGAQPPAAMPMRAPSLSRAKQDFKADAESANRTANSAAGAAGAMGADKYVSGLAERKINRNASLGVAVEVGTIETKSDQVEDAVKSAGGYIASNNLTSGGGFRNATIEAKVPEKEFDRSMKKFAALGKVISKQQNSEDITAETSDATSAEAILVQDLKAQEKRLQNASSDRSEEVRLSQLRQIRIQLAQVQSRLGLLRRMAAMSTITLVLTEQPKETPQPEAKTGFWSGMEETNRAATAAFQTALRVPLVMLMWTLAFSPIWIPALLVWRWSERKKTAAAATVAKADESER